MHGRSVSAPQHGAGDDWRGRATLAMRLDRAGIDRKVAGFQPRRFDRTIRALPHLRPKLSPSIKPGHGANADTPNQNEAGSPSSST
jgi:hypothetical protein